MFSWFFSKPACPVPDDAKQWIEDRFAWLIEEFGLKRLTGHRTVLPTAEFLPLEYDCSEEGLHELLVRVASFMGVDPDRLCLQFYEERQPPPGIVGQRGTAGQYSERDGLFDIWLEVHSLEDPASTLATLAHEVGHVLLLGEGRVSPEEEDHEPLTDLLTVFLGLGIFAANSVVHERNWQDGQWSGWSVGKRGYLSMDKFGYALALYALARNEPRPVWTRHLRPDVRAALKKGIRYVRETGDCSCQAALRGV